MTSARASWAVSPISIEDRWVASPDPRTRRYRRGVKGDMDPEPLAQESTSEDNRPQVEAALLAIDRLVADLFPFEASAVETPPIT